MTTFVLASIYHNDFTNFEIVRSDFIDKGKVVVRKENVFDRVWKEAEKFHKEVIRARGPSSLGAPKSKIKIRHSEGKIHIREKRSDGIHKGVREIFMIPNVVAEVTCKNLSFLELCTRCTIR